MLDIMGMELCKCFWVFLIGSQKWRKLGSFEMYNRKCLRGIRINAALGHIDNRDIVVTLGLPASAVLSLMIGYTIGVLNRPLNIPGTLSPKG